MKEVMISEWELLHLSLYTRRNHWMKAQWRKWSLHLKKDHTKTKSCGSSFQTIQRSKAHLRCFFCFLFFACFVCFGFVIWVRSPRTTHMFGKSLEGFTGLSQWYWGYITRSARGKDTSGRVWRNSCIDFLCFLPPTEWGQVDMILSPAVKTCM